MKKTDARVRYTVRVLEESFLTLLKDKPVNRVTVKEVCELAQLNRATFYAHFRDCFDLLDHIEQTLLEAFQCSLWPEDPFDVGASISAIYTLIQRHETACRVLIFEGRSPTVLARMIDWAREPTLARWKARLRRADDTELEMLYTHLSNGLMNVVVGGYDKYDRADVIRFVDRIVTSSLAPYR